MVIMKTKHWKKQGGTCTCVHVGLYRQTLSRAKYACMGLAIDGHRASQCLVGPGAVCKFLHPT